LAAWTTAGQYGDDPADPVGYVATFSVGYLAFQVAGQDFRQPDHVSRTGDLLGEVIPPDTAAPYLLGIWPQRPDLVVWPPLHHLSINDMATFSGWLGTQFVRVRRAPITRL